MDSSKCYSDISGSTNANTGYARYYYLTLSSNANYSALDAFSSYQSITEDQLKNISLIDYNNRMNDFACMLSH